VSRPSAHACGATPSINECRLYANGLALGLDGRTLRVAVHVEKRKEKTGGGYAEGSPRLSSKAMTAPSRPGIGGARAQAYADGLECAEGSRWRSVSYAQNVATPMTLLAGWPGWPIRRRSPYEQVVDVLRHSCSGCMVLSLGSNGRWTAIVRRQHNDVAMAVAKGVRYFSL
jgi:hypothetical protein